MATWNTDAQLAETIDEKFLATNSQLNSFLSDGVHGKFIIVAAKGMGKTLLLRHKRQQIENTHKDYFTIPRNSTADYVKPPSSPSKGMTDVMQSKGKRGQAQLKAENRLRDNGPGPINRPTALAPTKG